jgi:hypothetical protein
MFARHPRPDVRGTIAKDNTSSSFVLSQETDGVTIGEDQVRQIQDKDATSRLVVDYLAQLVHIVHVELTANREHHRPAAGAMNSQHRPRRCERNCQATRKVLERAGVLADVVRRDFGNGEIRDNANFKRALAIACETDFY